MGGSTTDRLTAVADVLGEAQRLGFLGPRPIPEVIEHAGAFVTALADVAGTVVDLGAGGGVPGLVIAADRPDLSLVLVDRRTKRTDFLDRVVRRLGWGAQVTVHAVDTDVLVREHGAVFDAAVARGFGPPATTVSTASRLVRAGGTIVISEPPTGDRWAPALLDSAGVVREPGPAGVARFRRLAAPRR